MSDHPPKLLIIKVSCSVMTVSRPGSEVFPPVILRVDALQIGNYTCISQIIMNNVIDDTICKVSF